MSIPQALLDELDKIYLGSTTESVAPKRGDEIFEGKDYPREWADFVGQADAKDELQVSIASATARRARIDHTLLASGLHGVGKSTLAHLVAYHAGVGLVEAGGPMTAVE